MVNVLTEIVINAPIQKVAEFTMNPDNAPLWYKNIKSIEWRTEKNIAVGSKMAFVAFFLGRKLEYTYEIIELIPSQKMIMRTAEGPFPMETSYEFEEIDSNSCKVKLRNSGTPTGFSKLFSPMMSSMMRKANKKDLILLKEIMERQ